METLEATGTIRSVYFSLGNTPATGDPKFDCATAVINLFSEAKETVHVAIYSLTEPDIVKAMIDANNRGVNVVVVADETESKNANMAAMIKKLIQAGIDVHLAFRQKALMHNKVGIFDSQTICTGSFNWTNNAEKKTMRTCWL